MSYLIIKRDRSDSADEIPAGHFSFRDIPLLIGGIALIIVSGHYLVESAIVIARFFGVSEWVIGVTIVAAGTSAPELATSLVGVLRGRHAISVGNLIGSDLFNLLGVLGLAAMISSLTVGEAAYGSLIVLLWISHCSRYPDAHGLATDSPRRRFCWLASMRYDGSRILFSTNPHDKHGTILNL